MKRLSRMSKSALELAVEIFSSYVFFHSEMEKFKKTFSLNGYPHATLVDSCIKSFLDKMYNSRDKVHTCSKKVIYFCLPLTGHHGLQIRSQLQKFLSSAYRHISLRVVFRPSFRLSNFFPFKDKIPGELFLYIITLPHKEWQGHHNSIKTNYCGPYFTNTI